ncbi:SERTA domain-containing protein 3 [Paramarasmius palmivorus]|uniref:SERTA domain-containing protein 3 n=1 Tax=Paramarasmius palmivorus TaxID=297713 RepID=A0AAW0C0U0_9AGAR
MARRKKNNNTEKEPQKRGNPGIFQGEPLTVLERWVPEYVSSRGNRAPFWARFFGDWRTQFPPLTAAEQQLLAVLRKRLKIKPIDIDFPVEGDSSLLGMSIFLPFDTTNIESLEEIDEAEQVPPSHRGTTAVSAEERAPAANTTVNSTSEPALEPAVPVVEGNMSGDSTVAAAGNINQSGPTTTDATSIMEIDVVNGSAASAAPVAEMDASGGATATAIPVVERNASGSAGPTTTNASSIMDIDMVTASAAVAAAVADASSGATATDDPVCDRNTTSHDSALGNSDATAISQSPHGNSDATVTTQSPQDTSSSQIDVPGPSERAVSPEPGTSSKEKKVKQKNKRSKADNILIARGATDERLKTWFGTRAVKEKATTKDEGEVWGGLISHFNKDHGKAPRHIPDYKVYEAQEEYQAKIDARLTERFGDDTQGKQRLCQHVDVARELFDKESDETKERIHEAAEALYQTRREEYEKRVCGEGLTEEKHIPMLREQMGAKLKPLFEAVALATNTRISFVAVGYNDASDDDAFFCNVLTGTTPGPNPQKFNEWDPVGYKMHHILSFAEFVKACARLEKGYPAAPPQHPSDLVSACDETADISTPTVGDARNMASSTSLPTTSLPSFPAAMASSPSSSSAQARKYSSKDIDSGDDTPHSPTPDLSSDDDQNIPDDTVDYGECGIKLAPGRRMGKFLAAELRNTSRQERTKKMLVFSKYTQKELDREEHAAKQRFLSSMMDEDEGDEEDEDNDELPSAPRSKGKRKAKGKGKGKTKGKRKKLEEIELEEEEEEEEEPKLPKPKRQRIEHHASNTEEYPIPMSHSAYATPPSTQLPASSIIPDAEAGARVTATGTGNAQASASALISAAGDADVFATARSAGSATSTARAVARGAGQQSDGVTSANINVDTQSAPPSPAKAGSNAGVPAPSSQKPAFSQDVLVRPSILPPSQNSPCPTLPPPSSSPAKSTHSPRSSARFSTQSSNISSEPPLSTSPSSSTNQVPAWVQQMRTFLLSDISGSVWVQSVDAWEGLEGAYNFTTSRQALPTVKRPEAVNFWTKRARRLADPPPDSQGPKFGRQVSDWWDSMMPKWRKKADNGIWIKDGGGDWGPMRCPGLNGFLSVMACLRWWLIQESGGSIAEASSSWRAVLDDVCWVMQELKKNEEEPARKKARSG